MGHYPSKFPKDLTTKLTPGKGVLKAVQNVDSIIAKELVGMDACDQVSIDSMMLNPDGTATKKKLGANAILSIPCNS